MRVDLRSRRVDLIASDDELAARRAALKLPELKSQTPWQEIYRGLVGQLSDGACLEPAVKYQDVVHTSGLPRHSH